MSAFSASSIDLSNLESLAANTSLALQAVPEEFFLDSALIDKFIEPMLAEASRCLGYWVCRIMPSHCLGCNFDGQKDLITGEDNGMFRGIFSDIDIVEANIESSIAGNLTGVPVPALVFETIDEGAEETIAQLYIHVAVPLVGTLVDIERVAYGVGE